MTSAAPAQPPVPLVPAWLCFGLAGVVAPAFALLLLAQTRAPGTLAPAIAPLVAIGLMGAGMIGAAIVGRVWVGIVLALLAGTALTALAFALGSLGALQAVSLGAGLTIASISFAARGALFARSAGARGWLIALAVVGGEAAVVATAAAQPGVLPAWLLALLPAQWAATAIGAAFTGAGPMVSWPVLSALGGTAATTLLVAALWPRRWPYLLMFSAWIGLSSLVYHAPTPAKSDGDQDYRQSLYNAE